MLLADSSYPLLNIFWTMGASMNRFKFRRVGCQDVLVGIDTEVIEGLAAKFGAVLPHLDERQRRLLMGAEARALGRGGIRLVARAAGVREATVSLGVDELEAGAEPLGRARRPGGGRKRAAKLDPGLVPALLALVEPGCAGGPGVAAAVDGEVDPEAGRGADRARGTGSAPTRSVTLLRAEGFSLQGNAKTIEGRRHPDRDAQFRYINEQARAYQLAADPVISVDTKKKEQVGRLRQRRAGVPAQGRPGAGARP